MACRGFTCCFGKLKDAFPQLQPLKPSAETNLVDKTKPSAKSAKAQKLTVKVVQYKTGRFSDSVPPSGVGINTNQQSPERYKKPTGQLGYLASNR